MTDVLPLGKDLFAIVCAAILALTATVSPQSPLLQPSAERPSFEVASIRPHDPSDRNTDNYQPYSGGRFTAMNCSPWMLIHYAFQLQPYQIVGGPSSIRSEHYDVDAKPAEMHPGTDDIPPMLQRLLEDRFQLKYHWETRDTAGYYLVVIKPGNLPKSIVAGDCLPDGTSPNGTPNDAACGYVRNTPGRIKSYSLTIDDLTSGLSWLLKQPITDKTNLNGKYDFDLRWTPESVQMQSGSLEQDAPSIFTAIQEQIGLKLQPAKVPVRMLIIDSISKPSDN